MTSFYDGSRRVPDEGPSCPYAQHAAVRLWQVRPAAVKWLTAIVILWMLLLGQAVAAQTVILDPKTTRAALREKGLEGVTIINGPKIRASETTLKPYDTGALLDGIQPHLMAILTLRLIDKGLASEGGDAFALETYAARLAPDVYSVPPWRRPVRLHNLLTGTGGFAVPPMRAYPLSQDHIPALLYELRHANMIAHYEPGSLFLLKAAAEHVTGKPINQLLDEEIAMPLGLPVGSIQDVGKGLVPRLSYSDAALGKVTQLLFRNRDKDFRPFLSADSFGWLSERSSWGFLPHSKRRALGLQDQVIAGARVLMSKSLSGRSGPVIAAIPDAGVAFIFPETSPRATIHAFLSDLIAAQIPRTEDRARREAGARLADRGGFAGRYLIDEPLSGNMNQRLAAIAAPMLVSSNDDGTLTLVEPAGTRRILTPDLPFTFTDEEGRSIAFSEYRQGGYMLVGDTLYKRTRDFMTAEAMIHPLAILLLIIVTSAVYWGKKHDRLLRFLARAGTIGPLLVVIGLYLEFSYWEQMIYIDYAPWAVLAWRLLMDVGLAGVLAVPLLALSVVRNRVMLTVKGRLLTQVHFLFLIIASTWLLVMLISWGIVSTAWPL